MFWYFTHPDIAKFFTSISTCVEAAFSIRGVTTTNLGKYVSTDMSVVDSSHKGLVCSYFIPEGSEAGDGYIPLSHVEPCPALCL